MNALRLGLLLAAAFASLASVLGPESDIPEPDLCQASTQIGVDTLRILSGDISGSSEISDFQVLPYVHGAQGGSMILLRFELGGGQVPECAAFDLRLERCSDADCQNVVAGESTSLAPELFTYEEGDHRVTRLYYWQIPEYIFVEGSLARLTVRVGSVSKQHLIWIDRMGTFNDAGLPDAGLPDAGLPDASAPDAGIADASPSDAAL